MRKTLFLGALLSNLDTAMAMLDPSTEQESNPSAAAMEIVPISASSETSLSGVDPSMLAIIDRLVEQRVAQNLVLVERTAERRIMQRLVPLLQRELDSVREENERSISALQIALDELSGRLIRDENTIRELTAQQQQEMAQRKVDMVHTAFVIGAANPELMPHHINDTATSISRKATIEERHVAVSAVYKQLKLLNNILPQDKLRIIGDYVLDTKVEEKIVENKPASPDYIRDMMVINEGMTRAGGSWGRIYTVDMNFLISKYGMRQVAWDWRGSGIAQILMRSSYGGENDNIRVFNHFKNLENDERKRVYAEEVSEIDSRNAEYTRRYEADVARAERIPFPAIQLDDLITQFNGLLTLHIDI
ncbi:MAG: hypothetical protein LBQ08_01365 [Holosporaceae bacterium]|jgi:hypothetical protein|nr:hypothetical protein [Holosporaceae bacterium]